MTRIGTFFVAPLVALALSACTAARVVTHSTSTDPVDAPAGRYMLDPDHASLVFDVDHLGYSRFVGRFNEIGATLDFAPDAPEQSRLRVTIKAASVDTGVAALDPMIAGDLLEADEYPEITFVSTGIARTGPAAGQIGGDLTLAGTTRGLTLDVLFNGGAPNPVTGRHTLGFSATGALSRTGFGLLDWLPAVGDEVRFRIEVEFVHAGAN